MKSTKPHLKLPRIAICGAAELRDLKHDAFTHVVSIWAADAPRNVEAQLNGMFPKAQRHVVFFDDVINETEDPSGPNPEHVRAILHFGRTLTENDTLLVQCLAGISRSSAAAFSIGYQLMGPWSEQAILDHLIQLRPHILPNLRMVRMADVILERGGAMNSTVESYVKKWIC